MSEKMFDLSGKGAAPMSKAPIDGGRPFDWSAASPHYAKYRDIYPDCLYQKLQEQGIGLPGQQLLDLGTGTGVLPRAMYATGARFTAVDAAPGQIAAARQLAADAGMEITFVTAAAEEAPFAQNTFDAATALQCFAYFEHRRLAPHLAGLLRPGGKFAVVYMGWLPAEDAIAAASEALVQRWNPAWTGGGDTRRENAIPADYTAHFAVTHSEVFDAAIPFTRESWDGRICSCRGIGAALPPSQTAEFSRAHRALLAETAPATFTIRHFLALTVLAAR